MNYSSKV